MVTELPSTSSDTGMGIKQSSSLCMYVGMYYLFYDLTNFVFILPVINTVTKVFLIV